MRSDRKLSVLVACCTVAVFSCASSSPDTAPPTSLSPPSGFENARRLTNATEEPKQIVRDDPWVPNALMRVNAVVLTELYIDETGNVVSTRYVGGDERFFFPAVSKATQRWKFQPLITSGSPSKFILPLTFTLTWRTNPLAADIHIRLTSPGNVTPN
jgi:hypothetical protein